VRIAWAGFVVFNTAVFTRTHSRFRVADTIGSHPFGRELATEGVGADRIGELFVTSAFG